MNKSRITSSTIKKYLDALEGSNLPNDLILRARHILRLPGSTISPILVSVMPESTFASLGRLTRWKKIIFNELHMRGYNVDVGVIPISEKDSDGKVVRKQLEVDFVCNMGSKRYYIQSAYSIPDQDKKNQEIRPFRRIEDSFKKIIVTKDIVPPHYDEYMKTIVDHFGEDVETYVHDDASFTVKSEIAVSPEIRFRGCLRNFYFKKFYFCIAISAFI